MSSNYPLVKFVDAPDPAATVRFDCNDDTQDAPRRVVFFDPGVPVLEGDPDAVGQQWGFRSPSLVVQFKGSKQDALLALSALSREQLRRTNWVMFQLDGSTSPMWLSTYRTGYESLSLDQVYVDTVSGDPVPWPLPDTWEVRVPLVADAFAYGERVTIPTVQIIQAPADLAGPTRYAMRYALPAIKGDAPTPLRVKIVPAATWSVGGVNYLIGCCAGTSTLVDQVFDIGTGDVFGAGTNTAGGVSNAADFGGSCRTVTVTASDLSAGLNFSDRLSGPLAVTSPGRYKVLLRFEADSGAAGAIRNYIFACGIFSSSGPIVYGPTARVTVGLAAGIASTHQGWVDLGEFTFPFGYNAPEDVVATISADISIKVGESSNLSGVVRLDSIKLLPVSGPSVISATYLKAARLGVSATTIANTFDGATEAHYSTSGSGAAFLGVASSLSGAFPVADPNAANNFLTVVALGPTNPPASGGAHQTALPTGLNAQLAVDVSYHPLYLHVGDGT